MRRLCLGIIFGSRSCEHEVSIISALQLYRHCDREKYDPLLIYISQQGEWYIGEKLADINTYRPTFKPEVGGLTRVIPDITARCGALLAFSRGKAPNAGTRLYIAARLDCALPVMHGLHGEDGTLQGLLEMMDIPYTSTGVAGSAIGMDKIHMKHYFRGLDFPILPGMGVLRSEWQKRPQQTLDAIEGQLPYPVYVKPANLGSSIGVHRANDREQLAYALEVAAGFDRRILVEKGVDKPIEVNCSVLGFDEEIISSVVEMPVVSGELLDFGQKYMSAGGAKGMASLSRVVPAPIGEELTQKIRTLSEEIFRAMDCKGVVRVDYMLETQTDKLYITEINTIPGSLAFYLWDKSEPRLDYPSLIDRMVELALRAYGEKCESDYAFRSDIFAKVPLGGGKGGAKGAGSKGKTGA